MKLPRTSFLLLASLALYGHVTYAQNGLHDIPDTDIDAQLKGFQLPEGAEINLFASEPIITKPTHMNWDQDGRLWVVGSPLYPHIKPGQEEQDRLVILEDTDGDGVADKHTVFADDLHIPTGVLPGDGGVYVANSIEILFLRDTDGDGKADERRVVLSGFGTEDTHHLVHTLRWGPEGMIWLNQSIYIHTHLETPYGIRRLMGGGMWHYRPETQRIEIFMKGLVNPWGHAFDQWGQSFLTDGAGGEGINFVFPRSIFLTSPGATRILHGLNPGQPKHCGLEILTGRHMPEDYDQSLIAPDFRGNRINRFKLTDNGSAYTSTQVEDLVASTHRAFRPIDVKMGPDGAIYVADFYNPIIQHGEVDFRDPRRDHEHGRIWRITFPKNELVKKPDIRGASDEQLVELLHAPESWTRQLATVEMRERKPESILTSLSASKPQEGEDPDLHALRNLWATQAINRFQKDNAARLLDSENHKVRSAALRAIYYRAEDNDQALSLAERAVSDPHPQVRLWGVSVLAQLDSPDTVKIALRALEGVEVDEFLDFALWNICREHAQRWTDAAGTGNPFENVRQLLFAVRALNEPIAVPQILAALGDGSFSDDADVSSVAEWIANVGSPDDLKSLLDFALTDTPTDTQKTAILNGLVAAGNLRKMQPAGDKSRVIPFLESTNIDLFSSAAALAGMWHLQEARPALETAFLDRDKGEARIRAALEGLRRLGGQESAQFLGKIANDHTSPFQLRSLAVIGRAKTNPKPGAQLALPVLRDAPEGKDPYGIFDAFLSNNGATKELTAALKGQELPEAIALTGVQKASSAATHPQALIKALQDAGGLKPMKMALTTEEMEAMMNRVAEKGDPHRGEAIYRRDALQCKVCHAIGGVGGIIGPDLVSIGSSAPIDYLINSLLLPSDKIKEGYHTALLATKSGDTYAGAVVREDANEIVIRDATGTEHRVAKSEVAEQTISPISLMPPGLTAQLREDEFVDLVRFLSELGKEGDFKTPPNRYIREWQVLVPHERTRDAIGHYGHKIFAENIETYQWLPLSSKVDGSLPVDEAPEVVGRGKNRYTVARFFLDAKKAGTLRLKVEGKLKDLRLLVGEKEIALPESEKKTVIELPVKEPGQKKLTISGLRSFGLDEVRIELLDNADFVEAISLKEIN